MAIKFLINFSAMIFSMITPTVFGQLQSGVVKDGAALQLVSKQFSFTEGPAVDKEGNIFFTDQPNDNIWKYDVDGKLSLFLHKTGRSNGTYFDYQGNLVSCADEQNELWSISSDGSHKVLMKDYQGHRLNGPNDLWIDMHGNIYFTDPYFQRDYWKRKTPDPKLGGEWVYFLPKGKAQPVVLDSTVKKPNGIVGTPDGKCLYVADMGNNCIFKYSIDKDGRISHRKLFVNDLADGITLDNQGNLYLAGNGVTVYSPDGKKIQHIDVPEKWTANICFGGRNKDRLLITASEAVYVLEMAVHGVE